MSFITVGPNECLVVSGYGANPPKMVSGGRAFVWPCVQTYQKLSLNMMTCVVTTTKVYTKHGVPINVSAVAQVKINSRPKILKNAARLFLGMSQKKVASVAVETLEGHQRAIMGTMTVEEIYQDRLKFSQGVRAVTTEDLEGMGLELLSYTITDVSDDVGYLKAIGEKRTAEVKRDATIGQASSKMEGACEAARADQVSKQAYFVNKIKEEASNRDYKLKQAEFDMEINTAKAVADAANPLQTAITSQKVMDEKMKIAVVERAKDIQVQEQEIVRRQRELDATVRKQAKAEKFRMETLSEADRNQAVLLSKGEAQAVKTKGDAEAYAIAAQAQAEAEAMHKKAEAFNEYKGAAIMQIVLDALPKVAAEIAAPLATVDKVTMVAGENGEVGAARMTGEVLDIMNSIPNTIQAMTGVNLGEAIARASRA
jgi:flotillin